MTPCYVYRLGFFVGALLSTLLPSTLHAVASMEKTTVFKSGEDGYVSYRIPAVIKAANGDLLAFAEGRKNSGADSGDIDLLLKRSSDGGKTWGKQQTLWDDGANTCGNPTAVVDSSDGTVWLFSTHNLGHDQESAIVNGAAAGGRTVWVLSSRDNGATWSSAKDVTATTKDPSWTWYATGPGIGIQIRFGPHAGRLVIPCDHDHKVSDPSISGRGSHVIYSDDHGVTWRIGGLLRPNMNECQVVELFGDQGTLLMDMRSYNKRARRAESTSTDGGLTWTAPADAPALVEPVCQASLIRWKMTGATKPGVLLFSNPADPTKRVRMTVRASADNGATWSRSLLLQAGPAAYSSLVALDNSTAACLYEEGDKKPYERIVFARFNFSDFTAP